MKSGTTGFGGDSLILMQAGYVKVVGESAIIC